MVFTSFHTQKGRKPFRLTALSAGYLVAWLKTWILSPVERALRAFRPVPASLTDLLPVQDLRQILEHELDAFGHGTPSAQEIRRRVQDERRDSSGV